MIRNLKVLIAAAMVLGAFGAFSASGAQAAEFHCSVEPCTMTLKPDGAVPSKTSHHVFIFKNSAVPQETVALTCEQVTGQATAATKTRTTLTVTGIAYDGCLDAAGNKLTVHMNGCTYTFTSHGKVGLTCPESKNVELTYGPASKCTLTIAGFADVGGITYKTIGVTPKREVTVEAKVPGIPVSGVDGAAGDCIFKLIPPYSAEYTTGNTIATAETDPGGVLADGWWE